MTLKLFEFVWLTVLRTRTSWYILCWWLTPGKKQLFRFGALKLEGISTCGCYLVKQAFVFFFWVVRLLGAHHTVRWPQKLSQGGDIQAPLRPGSFTCHLGRYRLAVQNDLAKAQAFKPQVGRPGLSPWRMSSSVHSLAEPFSSPRGIKIRALLG